MRKLAFALLLVVTVPITLWGVGHWTGATSSVASASTAAEAKSTPEPSAVPELQGPGSRAHEDAPSRSAATLSVATEDETRAASVQPTATILARIVLKETLEPIPGATLSIFPARSETHRHDEALSWIEALGEVGRTAEDGRLEVVVPADVELEIWAYVAVRDTSEERDHPIGRSRRATARLVPDERREIVFELRHGYDLSFWGRVVAKANGEPVAGARVKLSANRPMQVETDESGLFEVTFDSPGHVRVEADGFGPVLAAVGSGHARPDVAREIAVAPSARLTVSVSSLRPGESPVTVLLEARAYTLQQQRELHQERLLSHAEQWEQVVSQEGRCTFDSLPPQAPLVARLVQDGEIVRTLPKELVLALGEDRFVEWQLRGAATVRGALVDQAIPSGSSPRPSLVIPGAGAASSFGRKARSLPGPRPTKPDGSRSRTSCRDCIGSARLRGNRTLGSGRTTRLRS